MILIKNQSSIVFHNIEIVNKNNFFDIKTDKQRNFSSTRPRGSNKRKLIPLKRRRNKRRQNCNSLVGKTQYLRKKPVFGMGSTL